MKLRAMYPAGLGCLICLAAFPLMAAPRGGRIAGVVVDSAGTPRMGATILVSTEQLLSGSPIHLLTNAHGRFAATLPVGAYSVQVTLAGFMPAVEEHVRVNGESATLLEIVLGSAFSSFQSLRRQPEERVSSDDWTWALRSSAATRSVLRWDNGRVYSSSLANGSEGSGEDHGLIVLTAGADHPGSIANVADTPGTAVGYDMGIGAKARLLMAGQFSYGGLAPAGGFAAEWLPSGKEGTGPVSTVAVRESRMGPQGPIFHAMRVSQDDQLTLGDRVSVRYGGEYVAAGFAENTSALRPRAEVAVQLTDEWRASAIVASRAWNEDPMSNGPMDTTIATLDDFPMVLRRNGAPVLANGLHEELAVERRLGKDNKGSFTAAVFHDRSTHTGLIGSGPVTGPDFLQDYFSDAFAYDGGESDSIGVRVAYKKRLARDLSATLIYDYAGALAPNGAAAANLRDDLSTQYRHAVGGRVSATIPRLHTQVTSGYKWLSGPVVSQLDAYGESLYHLDPYLSMEVRQPLPERFPCHMEVLADMGNLLAQGYVPLKASDGNVYLIPSYRFFKGGVSFQF